MVRRIKRKSSRLLQPKEPWTIRELSPTGPPRTLLTNTNFLCSIKYGKATLTPGRIDPLLRLYQHTGIQKNGPFKTLDGTTYVVYSKAELEQIEEWADWIELVHENNVWRINRHEWQAEHHAEEVWVPLRCFSQG